ncbi:MAG: DNA-directed RNA polymerase subunit RpoH/Rpb5 C-terminal domain-containing protein [Nanoarchaeota archaeon]
MVTKNFLIPKHKKLNQTELLDVMKRYSLESTNKLPKIKIKDSALSQLDVEVGDVIEISRNSFAGETKYYRVVIE